jgi:hypothetical protein
MILLFDNNIYHLIILLNIAAWDCVECVCLHDCPLTLLEQKYLNRSLVGTRMSLFKQMGIVYQCDHVYEITIEFLSNMTSLIVAKITVLIALSIFNIGFTIM